MISASDFQTRLIHLTLGSSSYNFPKKLKDQLLLLGAISMSLSPHKTYSEPALNIELMQWLSDSAIALETDHVSIRRYLVDLSFLKRNKEGTMYTLNTAKLKTTFEPDVFALHPLKLMAEAMEDKRKRRELWRNKK